MNIKKKHSPQPNASIFIIACLLRHDNQDSSSSIIIRKCAVPGNRTRSVESRTWYANHSTMESILWSHLDGQHWYWWNLLCRFLGFSKDREICQFHYPEHWFITWYQNVGWFYVSMNNNVGLIKTQECSYLSCHQLSHLVERENSTDDHLFTAYNMLNAKRTQHSYYLSR